MSDTRAPEVIINKACLDLWRRLHRGERPGRRRGICREVLRVVMTGEESGEVMGCLYSLFQRWPHFSGSIAYPVPPTRALVGAADNQPQRFHIDGVAGHAFHTHDLYDPATEYGQLRLDLLDFLIEETRSTL